MGRPRKWPGKPHWHATETTFREIAGSSWRTAAAAAFVCDRRDLRAVVDREMTPDEIRVLDDILVNALGQHAENLQQRADLAFRLASQVAATGCQDNDTNDLQIETAVDLSDVPDAPFDATSLRPWEGIIRELMEDA